MPFETDFGNSQKKNTFKKINYCPWIIDPIFIVTVLFRNNYLFRILVWMSKVFEKRPDVGKLRVRVVVYTSSSRLGRKIFWINPCFAYSNTTVKEKWYFPWASPSSSAVKNLPTVQKTQETWVRSLGRVDPLEEGKATNSSIFAGKTPRTEDPGALHRVAKSRTRPQWLSTSMILSYEQFCCSVTQCVWLFVTLWTAAHQASLSLTISRSLPKFVSIASAMPSNCLILWCPLLLLPLIFPSIRGFSNESAVCIKWPE